MSRSTLYEVAAVTPYTERQPTHDFNRVPPPINALFAAQQPHNGHINHDTTAYPSVDDIASALHANNSTSSSFPNENPFLTPDHQEVDTTQHELHNSCAEDSKTNENYFNIHPDQVFHNSTQVYNDDAQSATHLFPCPKQYTDTCNRLHDNYDNSQTHISDYATHFNWQGIAPEYTNSNPNYDALHTVASSCMLQTACSEKDNVYTQHHTETPNINYETQSDLQCGEQFRPDQQENQSDVEFAHSAWDAVESTEPLTTWGEDVPSQWVSSTAVAPSWWEDEEEDVLSREPNSGDPEPLDSSEHDKDQNSHIIDTHYSTAAEIEEALKFSCRSEETSSDGFMAGIGDSYSINDDDPPPHFLHSDSRSHTENQLSAILGENESTHDSPNFLGVPKEDYTNTKTDLNIVNQDHNKQMSKPTQKLKSYRDVLLSTPAEPTVNKNYAEIGKDNFDNQFNPNVLQPRTGFASYEAQINHVDNDEASGYFHSLPSSNDPEFVSTAEEYRTAHSEIPDSCEEDSAGSDNIIDAVIGVRPDYSYDGYIKPEALNMSNLIILTENTLSLTADSFQNDTRAWECGHLADVESSLNLDAAEYNTRGRKRQRKPRYSEIDAERVQVLKGMLDPTTEPSQAHIELDSTTDEGGCEAIPGRFTSEMFARNRLDALSDYCTISTTSSGCSSASRYTSSCDRGSTSRSSSVLSSSSFASESEQPRALNPNCAPFIPRSARAAVSVPSDYGSGSSHASYEDYHRETFPPSTQSSCPSTPGFDDTVFDHNTQTWDCSLMPPPTTNIVPGSMYHHQRRLLSSASKQDSGIYSGFDTTGHYNTSAHDSVQYGPSGVSNPQRQFPDPSCEFIPADVSIPNELHVYGFNSAANAQFSFSAFDDHNSNFDEQTKDSVSVQTFHPGYGLIYGTLSQDSCSYGIKQLSNPLYLRSGNGTLQSSNIDHVSGKEQTKHINSYTYHAPIHEPPYGCETQHGTEFIPVKNVVRDILRDNDRSRSFLPDYLNTPHAINSLVSISQRVVRLCVRKRVRSENTAFLKSYKDQARADLLHHISDEPEYDHYGTGFVSKIDSEYFEIRTHEAVVRDTCEALMANITFELNILDGRPLIINTCVGGNDPAFISEKTIIDFRRSRHSQVVSFKCATPTELVQWLHLFQNVPVVSRQSLFEDSSYFTDSSSECSLVDAYSVSDCTIERQSQEEDIILNQVKENALESDSSCEYDCMEKQTLNERNDVANVSSISSAGEETFGEAELSMNISWESIVRQTEGALSFLPNITDGLDDAPTENHLDEPHKFDYGNEQLTNDKDCTSCFHNTTAPKYQDAESKVWKQQSTDKENVQCENVHEELWGNALGFCNIKAQSSDTWHFLNISKIKSDAKYVDNATKLTCSKVSACSTASNTPTTQTSRGRSDKRQQYRGVVDDRRPSSPLVIMERRAATENQGGSMTGKSKCPYLGSDLFGDSGMYTNFSSYAGEVIGGLQVGLFRNTDAYKAPIGDHENSGLSSTTITDAAPSWDYENLLYMQSTHRSEYLKSVGSAADVSSASNNDAGQDDPFTDTGDGSNCERETARENPVEKASIAHIQRRLEMSGCDSSLLRKAKLQHHDERRDFLANEKDQSSWDTDLITFEPDMTSSPEFACVESVIDFVLGDDEESSRNSCCYNHYTIEVDSDEEKPSGSTLSSDPFLNEANRTAHSSDSHAIIIAHPHGGPKMVSTGSFSRHYHVGGNLYDTPTCMGSCGAPVISCAGDGKSLFLTHLVHAGTVNVNNISTGIGVVSFRL